MEIARCLRQPGFLPWRLLLGVVVAFTLTAWLSHPANAADVQGDPAEPGYEVPDLFERLGSTDTPTVRDACEKLNKTIGPKDLDVVLRAALNLKKNVTVRGWAVRFFPRFAKMPEETIQKRIVPVLLRLLRDKNLHVRREATWAATWYAEHSPWVVDRLIQLTRDDDWPTDREGIPLFAVGALRGAYPKDKRGYQFLLQLGKTGPDRLRVRAISELGFIGQIHRSAVPLVIPQLLAIVKDTKRPDIDRLSAMQAFRYMGPAAKDAVPALLQLMKNPEARNAAFTVRFRAAAIAGLVTIGPSAKDAVPDLIKVVDDDKRDWDERRIAIDALGAIGSAAKAAIPVLTRVRASAKRDRRAIDYSKLRTAEMALKKIQGK